jgi:hypothetical protein
MDQDIILIDMCHSCNKLINKPDYIKLCNTIFHKKCAKEWKEICPDCNKYHNTNNYKKFIYLSILISVAAAGGVCALFIL